MTIFIKTVGKIFCKESHGPFKAYIENQNTYCLKCKQRTNNKLFTPKPLVNTLIAQKSICSDCGYNKSIFVKEYKPKT